MVRESRWKRGLVEGGIILASVLLAFWVDAWWERGQDRALEAAVLDAVAEEMEGNRRNLLSTLDQTDARLLRIDRFLAMDSAGASSIQADSLLALVDALPNFPRYNPVHSAATMLLQTPVQDEAGIEVRKLVDDYLRAWGLIEALHDGSDLRRDAVLDALAPYAARDADSARERRLNPMVARQGGQTLLELRGDQRVVTAVMRKLHWQDVYRMELQGALETLESVYSALVEL